LRPSDTRWLSLQACVERIIQQWDALQLFFTNAAIVENVHAAEPILLFLSDKKMKCFMLFLNFILPKINTINKFFQRNDVIIHKIKKVLNSLYKQICRLFMQQQYVLNNETNAIDPFNEEEILDINLINLGNKENSLLNEPNSPNFNEEVKQFVKTTCLRYYQELCLQIKRRFNNLQDNYFDILECISPNNALSPEYHLQHNNCIEIVAQHFIILLDNENDVHIIINQWNNFILYNDFPDFLRDEDILITEF